MNDDTLNPKAFFELLREIAGEHVWAFGLSDEDDGNMVIEVFCDNKKTAKKLPKVYKGKKIKPIIKERPNCSTK